MTPVAWTNWTARAGALAAQVFRSDVSSSIAAVVVALALGVGLIAADHANPLDAYRALVTGAFGSSVAIGDTLVAAVPLTIAGVGVAIAFRGGIFNIGAEGQLLLGATAAAVVGLHVAGAGHFVAGLAMALAAMAVGALWALIPAVLKVTVNASEVLNTLMLNYIAAYLIDYLLNGVFQDPKSPLAQTALLPGPSRLPIIWGGTTLYAGIFVAAAVVVVGQLLLWRTTWGFKLRVIGKSVDAARSYGISPSWMTISGFLASGGLAGLAGYCVVAGVQYHMATDISPGWGYTAIVVALLGRTSPVATAAAALFFAALQVGATSMEAAEQVPASTVTTIQYLVVLLVIARIAYGSLRRPTVPET